MVQTIENPLFDVASERFPDQTNNDRDNNNTIQNIDVGSKQTDNPKITTGAGDHFNAGFCAAKLNGFSPLTCLALATCTSGHYVRTAQSPTTNQIIELLKQQ